MKKEQAPFFTSGEYPRTPQGEGSMTKEYFTEEDFGGLSREFWFPEVLEIVNAKVAQLLEDLAQTNAKQLLLFKQENKRLKDQQLADGSDMFFEQFEMQKARIIRLEEALRFYANEDYYYDPRPENDGLVAQDHGEKARAALEEGEK